jgi:hypothetical protein
MKFVEVVWEEEELAPEIKAPMSFVELEKVTDETRPAMMIGGSNILRQLFSEQDEDNQILLIRVVREGLRGFQYKCRRGDKFLSVKTVVQKVVEDFNRMRRNGFSSSSSSSAIPNEEDFDALAQLQAEIGADVFVPDTSNAVPDTSNAVPFVPHFRGLEGSGVSSAVVASDPGLEESEVSSEVVASDPGLEESGVSSAVVASDPGLEESGVSSAVVVPGLEESEVSSEVVASEVASDVAVASQVVEESSLMV